MEQKKNVEHTDRHTYGYDLMSSTFSDWGITIFGIVIKIIG
jgi:hypothetical protein